MTDEKGSKSLSVFGLLMMIGGLIICLVGIEKSGAAEFSDTLNIGLLNDKTNAVLFGGFTSTIGAIFHATNRVISAIRSKIPL